MSFFIVSTNNGGETVFRKYTDYYYDNLMINDIGVEICVPGKTVGPEKREFFVVHKIIDGIGIFIINGKKYNLKKGDMFYIPAGVEVYYKSDNTNPLSYIWVTFTGNKAETIMNSTCLANNFVIEDEDDLIERHLRELMEYVKMPFSNYVVAIGKLYVLLGYIMSQNQADLMLETRKIGNDYVDNALEYIEKNFNKECSAKIIAESIGVTRGYLCKLFVRRLGIPPSQYIEKFRIQKACDLLINEKHKLVGIADAVGYKDYAYFSNVFKKNIGVNPSEFINRYSNKTRG